MTELEGIAPVGTTRRGVLRAAGLVGLGVAASSGLVLATAAPAYAMQSGWRWCYKCEGLWFAFNGTPGRCPAGDGHSDAGSGDYTLKFDTEDHVGQNGWRHCTQCQGLVYYGEDPTEPRLGPCAFTFGYHAVNTGWYRIDFEPTVVPDGQQFWRWCKLCEGMWFGYHSTRGRCFNTSALDRRHDGTGSGNYILRVKPIPW